MTAPKQPSSVVHVNETTFDKEVLQSDKLILIDFSAEWCGPCKALAPTLEAFASENKNVKVVKIDIDESPNLAAAFGVQSIPTLVTMKDGQALFGAMGNMPKQSLVDLVAHSVQSLQGPANDATPPAASTKKKKAPKAE